MKEVLKILLIESGSGDFSKFTDFLDKSGFRACIASSREAVFSEIENHIPDIILFDSQFSDALTLCGTIKKMPDLNNPVIIFVCDENTPFHLIEAAIEEGADTFLFKPFSEVMLFAGITAASRILDVRKAHEQHIEKTEVNHAIFKQKLKILSKLSKSPNLYKAQITDYLHEITESTANFLHVDRVSIWFFDENRTKIICDDQYVLNSYQHLNGDVIAVDDFPVYFEVIKNTTQIAAADVSTNEFTKKMHNSLYRNSGIVSKLDFSFNYEGEIAGIIWIESIGEPRNWSQDEIDFVNSMAAFVAVAFAIVQSKKNAEKVIENDKLKSKFIANLSHKIRTPLNAVSGFLNLIADKDLDENTRNNYINIISINIQHLINLANDVVDISKIQNGHILIENKPENLNAIFGDINKFAGDLLSLYHKNHLNLITNLPSAGYFIETDSNRVKQIFGYLIDNAIKYTLQGSIEIGYVINDDESVSFFVKDTGIGIPAEKPGSFIMSFNQFEQYYMQKNRDSGLGLAISNGLVSLMKGTAWIESQYGLGTTFWFKLPPGNKLEIPQANKILSDNSEQEINWQGKKILIVEDVINNYELLEKMLQKTNATILWADTGQLALQFFKNHLDLSLVLMDIKLPDIDGLELTRHMKENRPSLPVIAQTAFAMSGDREKVFESGCDEYLPKPISRIKLLRVLSQYIK
jgi:signal transduction histidine kinase/DNA-binding response OmpR family regulator